MNLSNNRSVNQSISQPHTRSIKLSVHPTINQISIVSHSAVQIFITLVSDNIRTFVAILPEPILSSIHCLQLVTLANTVQCVVGQFLLPKLTAPCRNQVPACSHTRGPPLSPLHPPEALDMPLPAHRWALASIKFPYFCLHIAVDTTGNLACCRMSAAGAPPAVRPQPETGHHNCWVGTQARLWKGSLSVI